MGASLHLILNRCFVQSWLSVLLASRLVEEAPFDWLVDRQRSFAQSILALGGAAGSAFVVIFTLTGPIANGEIAYTVSLAAISSTSFSIAFRYLSKQKLSTSQFHRCVTLCMLLLTSIGQYTQVFPTDPVVRARAASFSVFAFKIVQLSLGLPMKSFLAISAWSFLHEVLSTIASPDVYPIRYYVIVILIHMIYIAIARQQHIWLKQLYDAQECLRAEKDASKHLVAQLKAEQFATADLLSMVCDATIWLASDGDTVARSEPRFDGIIGHCTLNSQFTSFMPREEVDRFRDAIPAGSTCEAAVQVLTTTLLNSNTGGRVDVELLMVDRLKASTEKTILLHIPRYLVGVRLAGSIEPETSGPAEDTDSILNERRKRVSFDSMSISQSSTTSSRPSGGILKKRAITNMSVPSEAFCGTVQGPAFETSSRYLQECSKSLLEDLVSSWNFNVSGCCSWHASLQHLETMVWDMKTFHQCAHNWRPDAERQCRNCTAIIGRNLQSEECWLCCEPWCDGS